MNAEVDNFKLPGLDCRGERSHAGGQKARPEVPTRAAEQMAEAERSTEPAISDAELNSWHWLLKGVACKRSSNTRMHTTLPEP